MKKNNKLNQECSHVIKIYFCKLVFVVILYLNRVHKLSNVAISKLVFPFLSFVHMNSMIHNLFSLRRADGVHHHKILHHDGQWRFEKAVSEGVQEG